jgi:hypothetical protein
MAKKTARRGTAQDSGGKIPAFAEQLGRFLGTTERQASEWLGQKKVIVQQLSAVRDQAEKLIRQLTGGAADMAVAVGVARGIKATGRKRGRKKMSAAEKKAVSERMKKYWADRRSKTARTTKKTAK